MATVSKWTPFGVALDITATASTVTRTSATQYKVVLNVSWETYYSGAKTNYGMSVTSGGVTKTISSFGTNRSSGSGSIEGTYTISGNGSASKTISVTFKNFNSDNDNSATKPVSVNVTVPAWTSYAIKYNANGGTGAPSAQTKWKDQTLKISTTKPTRTGYSFKNWNTTSGGSGTSYSSGANYTANAAATLYAQWTAVTYTVTFNANGGTGAPANQTKTYGKTLTLSGTKPTRSGYTFKGWGTSASATAITYAPGASYTANKAITLYAVWEISYTLPKISDVSVRWSGSLREITENNITTVVDTALVSFSWTTSEAVSSIIIQWEWESGGATAGARKPITASGTSGIVNTDLGELDMKLTHNITITVSDSGGSWTVARTLSGAVYPIGLLPENKGVSFGKSPEVLNYADFGYKTLHRKQVDFENNQCIYGTKPDGVRWETFNPCNASGNTVLGYDNYENKNGNTNIYGYDVNIGVSNIASPGYYRPYRRQGDSLSLTFRGAGYVTNAGKDVSFWIPVSSPIIGSPTVTIATGNGFSLRQGEHYTHGSTASSYTTPASYEATVYMFHGVYIKAVFSNTTNVINNAPIGILWNGTITFS